MGGGEFCDGAEAELLTWEEAGEEVDDMRDVMTREGLEPSVECIRGGAGGGREGRGYGDTRGAAARSGGEEGRVRVAKGGTKETS